MNIIRRTLKRLTGRRRLRHTLHLLQVQAADLRTRSDCEMSEDQHDAWVEEAEHLARYYRRLARIRTR